MDENKIKSLILFGSAAGALFLAVMGFAGWSERRGLALREVGCAWSDWTGDYRVSGQIENTQRLHSVADLQIQFRFFPPRGEPWPDERVRARFGAINQRARVLLKPLSSHPLDAGIELPGLRDYRCEARVWILGQHRFSEAPGEAVLESL